MREIRIPISNTITLLELVRGLTDDRIDFVARDAGDYWLIDIIGLEKQSLPRKPVDEGFLEEDDDEPSVPKPKKKPMKHYFGSDGDSI